MSELATANTEFHDPERIKLLTDLKAVLNCNVSSTVHAHLWLSDIDELKALVDVERRKSGSAEAIFRVTDKDAKTIGKCESILREAQDILRCYLCQMLILHWHCRRLHWHPD